MRAALVQLIRNRARVVALIDRDRPRDLVPNLNHQRLLIHTVIDRAQTRSGRHKANVLYGSLGIRTDTLWSHVPNIDGQLFVVRLTNLEARRDKRPVQQKSAIEPGRIRDPRQLFLELDHFFVQVDTVSV